MKGVLAGKHASAWNVLLGRVDGRIWPRRFVRLRLRCAVPRDGPRGFFEARLSEREKLAPQDISENFTVGSFRLFANIVNGKSLINCDG